MVKTHSVRRSSNKRTLAQLARRKLLVSHRATGSCPDLLSAIRVAQWVDPTVVQFGGNLGFKDGSVLMRGLYQRRERGQYLDYDWAWRALHG